MKAYVTSIGEPTTRLCIEQLKRHGFEVEVLQDDRPLWAKLKDIYNRADDDFMRVDADVIVNRNLAKFTTLDDFDRDIWWIQGRCFGWYSQDVIHGGVQFIRREALEHLRLWVDAFQNAERPETELSRIRAFHNPRRFVSIDTVLGLHGYKQGDYHRDRVKAQKARRGQFDNYDFDVSEALEAL